MGAQSLYLSWCHITQVPFCLLHVEFVQPLCTEQSGLPWTEELYFGASLTEVKLHMKCGIGCVHFGFLQLFSLLYLNKLYHDIKMPLSSALL